MIEVPSRPELVVAVGDFAYFTPEDLFAYFVTPEHLVKWWPQEAVTEPLLGGSFRLSWPDMKWILEGKYTAFHLGRHLGFTWSWQHDHTKETPQQVDLYFIPIDGGARLSVFHGPFSDPADRQGVLEGWIHFGMRLAGLRRTDPDPVP